MSILPDPRRQGDIKFIFFKKLAYITRIKFILGLFVVGLLTQLLLNFWFGLAYLGLATALSLIEGYADKARLKGAEEWKQVTPDEYKKVKSKQKQLEKWDRDCFDITNSLGVAIFVSVALFCFVIWIMLECDGQERLALFWGWDVFVILAPHWITGTRSFLRKDRLIIKIELLEKIMDYLRSPSDIQVLPMLSVRQAEKDGRVPIDARLMVRYLDAPKDFLGLQIQVSINSVQGKDYPYLYCVLIAKPDKRILNFDDETIRKLPRNISFEKRTTSDVDVIVIRQRTTRTSGYYTKLRASRFIVQTSLNLMRQLLKNNPGKWNNS